MSYVENVLNSYFQIIPSVAKAANEAKTVSAEVTQIRVVAVAMRIVSLFMLLSAVGTLASILATPVSAGVSLLSILGVSLRVILSCDLAIVANNLDEPWRSLQNAVSNDIGLLWQGVKSAWKGEAVDATKAKARYIVRNTAVLTHVVPAFF